LTVFGPGRRPLLRRAMRIAALLLAPLVAGCAPLGPPEPAPGTGYRARVTVAVFAPDRAVPVFFQLVERYADGKRRREATIDGEGSIWIDRPDLRVTWTLDPRRATFEERGLGVVTGRAAEIPDPFGWRARPRFTNLGPETLDGVATERYSVEGRNLSGTAWLMPDGVPVRFRGRLLRDGVPVELEIRYGQIVRGTVEARLFEIPRSFEGYAERRRLGPSVRTDIEDAVRGLQEQQRGRPAPPGMH
jgi:hypothetical protein